MVHYFEVADRILAVDGPLASKMREEPFAPKRVLYVLLLARLPEGGRRHLLLGRLATAPSPHVRTVARAALG